MDLCFLFNSSNATQSIYMFLMFNPQEVAWCPDFVQSTAVRMFWEMNSSSWNIAYWITFVAKFLQFQILHKSILL